MKILVVALLSAMSLGGVHAEDIVATTLFSDGTTNTWTQADLLQALQLINRKYHRDCERGEGRRAWHGAMRETVTTNELGELVKREIHEDGQTFTFTSRVVTASASVAAANSRLKATMSRGVPAALAAARQAKSVTATTASPTWDPRFPPARRPAATRRASARTAEPAPTT